MSKEWIIWYEHENCTQCHGCEVACRSWRGLTTGVSYRKVLNIWRGRYPHVKCHSVSLGCLHCAEPRCVEACPEDAIVKRQSDGLVRVRDALCTGCGACVDACPYGIPQLGSEGIMEKCDLCMDQAGREYDPPCVMTCPGAALSLREVTPEEKEGHQKTIIGLMA